MKIMKLMKNLQMLLMTTQQEFIFNVMGSL